MAYSMNLRSEWNPNKDKANRIKHGLSFDEAKELFAGGKRFLEIYDDEHSDEEDRFMAIGPIRAGKESYEKGSLISARLSWRYRWLKTCAS